MELDPKQLEAVNACLDLKQRIVAVTGKAGTGKTSIIKHVYDTLTAAGYSVAVCAPTGKAAKRIFEATGIRAVTIHKLLEYPHPGERDEKGRRRDVTMPKRCRMNPLTHDVVLCDEYAMVNQTVHRSLIDALPSGGCIRAFGDANQLPPIEESEALRRLPTPFNDMLQRFTGITLETIHRQGAGSGVVYNGARILSGWSPVRRDDFVMHVTEQPVDKLIDLVMEALNAGIDYSSIDNQIITPTNKRWIGTYALNGQLQRIFRPEMDGWLDVPRHSWDKIDATTPARLRLHVGDKVVCTQNNYDIGSNDPNVNGLFNGETGIVVEITEYGEILIDVGDRIVNVPPEIIIERGDRNIVIDPRRDLQLAYALTTHKCQGSEYKNIIYVINKSVYGMLNRKNLYTAVTRARLSATVITDMRGLNTSLATSMPRF